MPGGDRTGPAGMGPMTGRAAGYCAGYSVPGYMNPIPGRGWYGHGYGYGYGYGRGWGWRARAYPPPAYNYPLYPYGPAPAPQEEASALKEQAKLMEKDLEAIKKRIQELESTAAKEK